MNELQILRNELDIDQPASHVFEVPPIAVAFLLGNGRPHFDYVAGDQFGVAWPAQNVANNVLDTLSECRRTRNHARTRERHVFPGPRFGFLIGSKAIESRGQRTCAPGGP